MAEPDAKATGAAVSKASTGIGGELSFHLRLKFVRRVSSTV